MDTRFEAVRNTKEVTLYSRSRNVLNDRFGYIATALDYLTSGTVIDGEVVGLGPNVHADFYLLQSLVQPNQTSSITPLTFWFMGIVT